MSEFLRVGFHEFPEVGVRAFLQISESRWANPVEMPAGFYELFFEGRDLFFEGRYFGAERGFRFFPFLG